MRTLHDLIKDCENKGMSKEAYALYLRSRRDENKNSCNLFTAALWDLDYTKFSSLLEKK